MKNTLAFLAALLLAPPAVLHAAEPPAPLSQSDKQPAGLEKREREFTVENKYLVMPIQNKTSIKFVRPSSTITLSIDGKAVRQYDLNLAPSAEQADWYAFFTIGNYKGKKARVEVTAASATGFALVKQSDKIPGEENFYKEPHRPQFHYSQKVGWNNDPNGMVYHDGKWHLFYQHNPVGLMATSLGWGHAISTDLIHWEEQPDKLFPKTMAAGFCFSGSIAVDKANTGGWGKDTLVAFFTDTARSECIAYSTDGGESFTYYDKNSVLKHVGRDPYVFWYQYGDKDTPLNDEAKRLGGHWVMGVFEFDVEHNKEKTGAFYTSTNMKDWTKQSRVTGIRECPNLIEMPVDRDNGNRRWVLFGADALYQVGTFDGKAFKYEHEGKYQVHSGAYYASQVFNNPPDGRKVQIGWVGHVPAPGPYTQNFSFPCDLTLRKTADGIRMFANPIKEIETLRAKTNKAEPQKLAADQPLNLPVGSDLLDIHLAVEVGNAATIELKVAGASISYDTKAKLLRCANMTSAGAKGPSKTKAVRLPPVDGKIKIRVLLDRSLMDVVGNDGEIYITTTGPGRRMDADKVSVMATGGEAKLVEFEAHELKSIWNAADRQ